MVTVLVCIFKVSSVCVWGNLLKGYEIEKKKKKTDSHFSII